MRSSYVYNLNIIEKYESWSVLWLFSKLYVCILNTTVFGGREKGGLSMASVASTPFCSHGVVCLHISYKIDIEGLKVCLNSICLLLHFLSYI